jgi:hypothetical protein
MLMRLSSMMLLCEFGASYFALRETCKSNFCFAYSYLCRNYSFLINQNG